MGRVLSRGRFIWAVHRKMQVLGYTDLRRFPVDPWAIAEAEEIEVIVCPLGSISGIMHRDAWLRRIRLNEDQPWRHTYTLMHELIHYWFHPPGTYCENDGNARGIYEIQANHGAAEALMPEWAVREVGVSLDWDVQRLAHALGVSKQAMEIRLEELGIKPVA